MMEVQEYSSPGAGTSHLCSMVADDANGLLGAEGKRQA
jgi:hypothetical protein